MRNPYFDNLKFILIILVVVGHVIGVIEDRFLQATTRLIYSFHMPVFVFIAGYFYRRIKLKEIFFHLFLYTIFQAIYLAIRYILKHDIGTNDFFTPYYIMWFLLSLVSWKLLTPYVIKLRHPVITLIVISVLFGYNPFIETFFSVSRTIFFFPFFLLGHALKDKPVIKVNKIVSFSILLLLFICFYSLPPIKLAWFSGPFSYEHMGAFQWYAGFYRVAIYAIIFISSAAFLSLVPSGKYIYTEFGKNTMIVYLLHGIPIHALYLCDYFKTIDVLTEKIGVLVLSILWGLLLTCLPVKIQFRPSKT